MTASPIFVGVDVAKETLDVGLRPSGEGWSVTNEEAGVAALVARLRSLSPTLVVCEATGGFERAVIAALAAAGLPVVVANPRQRFDLRLPQLSRMPQPVKPDIPPDPAGIGILGTRREMPETEVSPQ